MTLASVVSLFDVVGSASAAAIAYLVYQWSRKSHLINAIKEQNNEWQIINSLVIADDDLIDIEIQNHPFENLNRIEIKKMYLYFLILNSDYNSWVLAKENMTSSEFAEARLNNHANLLFKDRDFIETNVFPRGYDEGFCVEIRKRWREIDKSKAPLRMPMS